MACVSHGWERTGFAAGKGEMDALELRSELFSSPLPAHVQAKAGRNPMGMLSCPGNTLVLGRGATQQYPLHAQPAKSRMKPCMLCRACRWEAAPWVP